LRSNENECKPLLSGADQAAKSAALARSVVKPYSVASLGGDGNPEKFVALMLPAAPSEAAPTAEDAAAEEYQWAGAYSRPLLSSTQAVLVTSPSVPV
jgi:hypothetical protein